jgi:hypothetical protein
MGRRVSCAALYEKIGVLMGGFFFLFFFCVGDTGGPADGPWNKNAAAPMEDVKGLLEMDAVLEATRAKLNALASQGASKGVNGALIMALVVLNWCVRSLAAMGLYERAVC